MNKLVQAVAKELAQALIDESVRFSWTATSQWNDEVARHLDENASDVGATGTGLQFEGRDDNGNWWTVRLLKEKV